MPAHDIIDNRCISATRVEGVGCSGHSSLIAGA